jgi:hypothetical protein
MAEQRAARRRPRAHQARLAGIRAGLAAGRAPEQLGLRELAPDKLRQERDDARRGEARAEG